MANQVFVDIVFRKDKKSDLIKKTEKEAGKAGRKAGQQFGKGFSKNVKAQVKGVDSLFTQMRKNIIGLAGSFLVFRGITSSISGAFNSMREFSRSIAEVNSILPKNTKLTQESIDTFSRFAGQFGTSSQGQAKAFYSIVSAGVRGTTKQLKTLKVANQAAVAGLVDINTASRSLVSSVNAYAKSGLTAQQASDSLFVAVREGQTTFGELADFLGNTSAIASSAGVSFDELTGTVSALTKGGIETSKATIALRGVLTSLIKPSDDAKKAARTLGLEFGVSAVKAKGLVGFLKDVADKTGGSTVALGKLFGNVRGLSGVLKLINGDFADFKRIIDETKTSTGATNEAFKEIKKSTDFKITQLTSEIKAFGDQLLTTAQGPMITFLTGVKQIFKALSGGKQDKSIIQLAREELKKIKPELAKVNKSLENQAAIQRQIRLTGNKDIEKNLLKRQAFLQKNKDKNLAIIRAFTSKEVETEKQKQKRLKTERTKARKEESEARAASSVNAILKAQELGVLSLEQLKQQQATKMQILLDGAIAEGELKGITDEQLLVKKQEFFEREAQLEAAADAQRTAIEDAATNKALGDMALRSTGMENYFKRIGISGAQTGKILKQGFFGAMDKGFRGIGAAIANGTNAFDAFVGGVKSALGDVASAFGDLMIKKGLAVSLSPILGGPAVGGPMIAAGAGLKILAGFLGASGSSAASGGGSGASGGAFSSGIEPLEAGIEEPEIQQQGPRVALTIEGSLFDTDDTRKSIVEFLNESFSEDGASLDNASFA